MINKAKSILIIIFSVLLIVLIFSLRNRSQVTTYASGAKPQRVSVFSELYSMEFTEETTIKTSGYATENDGGAANYLVNSDPGDGSIADIPLNNGFYAHLQYGDTVNVASLGILPGNECSVMVNSALTYFGGRVEKLVFNNGVYTFADRVYFSSVGIEGKSDTVFYVSPDFNPSAHFIFLTDMNKHDVMYDILISKVTFLFEDSKDHTSHGEGVTVLGLSDISSCNIKNCNFIARSTTPDGGFINTTLLWFMNTNCKNIAIENCNFQNLTGIVKDNASEDHLVGGCIWFSGLGIETAISNVRINKCTMESTTSDEVIAIWNCNCNDFAISNSTIKSIHYYSHNIFSVYGALTSNFVVSKCKFIANAPTFTIAKIFNLADSSQIEFLSCTFDMNTPALGRQMQSFIYTNDNGNFAESSMNRTISLEKCTFKSKEDEKFTYLVSLYGAQNYSYIIKKCKVKASYGKAVFSVYNTDKCDIEIVNTRIKTDNPNEIVEANENTELTINNN